MSGQLRPGETTCRFCGESFGNPGARATHERDCPEGEGPPEPSEPPYVECQECGRRLPWRPVVASHTWRANHVSREHERGGRATDYFEWVGRDKEITDEELRAALEDVEYG